MTQRAHATGLASRERRLLLSLAGPVAAALIASGVSPYHRGTWLLEVAPVMLAIPVGYAAANPLARVLAPADVIVAMGVITCAAAAAVFAYAPYRRQALDAVGAAG